MSRDLLVIAAIALLCLLISPLYKEKQPIVTREPPLHGSTNAITISRHTTIKTSNPKTMVLLSDTFLPGSFAGSEITAYETLKYLRERGHNIIVIIRNPKVSEYDGFKIYNYDTQDKFCRDKLLNADIVFYQMKDDAVNFKVLEEREKPLYILIHVVNCYHWLLPQKVAFPVVVVYNSRMTQDTLPTIHDNMRMIPYVNVKPFLPLREYTIQNDIVCLINCNKNKGSGQFNEIVEKMPHVQFIGVKGGYAEQDLMKPCPANLTYMDNQKDVRVIFKKIGILLMPSKNETWGRTAVEAMASGVPVIHSEAGGLVECVSGAGILCQRDDIDAWCQAIEHIIGDRAYREQLRQMGFKRVKEIEAEQVRGRQELALKIESRDY